MICNRDCFNCQYDDCIEDDLTAEELKSANNRDKNSDRILSDDYRTRWAQLNPVRNKKNKQNHYQNNKDKYKLQQQNYYQTHKEELNRKRKELYYANREYELARQKEQKARKTGELKMKLSTLYSQCKGDCKACKYKNKCKSLKEKPPK